MIARALTALIVLIIFNSNVVGKDYVAGNSDPGTVNQPSGELSLTKDVVFALGDSEKNEASKNSNLELTKETPSFVSPTENSLLRIEETASPGNEEKLDYFAAYDKGFGIFPYDKKKNPFELKINGWIQFRHHAFAREVDSWTDNAGITRPVRNRNAFDIERARLSFKGTALDPRLTYFYQLDGDTDGRHTVDFFDYWWAWKVSDRFRLQFGKRKVSASRQWLLGARRTRFIDRPMSNDFFRPDRTIGIWGQGKTGENGTLRTHAWKRLSNFEPAEPLYG